MHTFSRLTLLFVFLCMVLMLEGGIADAQEPFLEVAGSEGFDGGASVGDEVAVTFQAGFDSVGQAGIPLDITATNVTDIVINGSPATLPGTYTTDFIGLLKVTGTLTEANGLVEIRAAWMVGHRKLDASVAVELTDAQELFLEVVDSTGFDGGVSVGDAVEVTFKAGFDGSGVPDVPLMITATPNINITSHTVPGTYNTGIGGILTVAGTLTEANGPVEIRAVWTVGQGRVLNAAAIAVNGANGNSTIVKLLPSPVPSPAIGEQLMLSLDIANGKNVAGYQATVKFDATALRYISSANGDYLPAGAFFIEPVVEGNLIKLNAVALAGESNGDGTLATLTFEVIAVKASTLTLSDVLVSNMLAEAFLPEVENAQITQPTRLAEDVNADGTVDLIDLVLVASNLGKTGQDATDVNGDGQVNIADLVLVAAALGTDAAAPARLSPDVLETFSAVTVNRWLTEAKLTAKHTSRYQRGIRMLEQLLAALTPKETALLANYPNPFNPETWIPYQLAKDADVSLSIYAVDGRLVRTLALEHQPAGMYQSKGRAAYWDGRNSAGEPVASGVYFYTLTAGEYTATRKMLIRK